MLAFCKFCHSQFTTSKNSKGQYCSKEHYLLDRLNVSYEKFLRGEIKHRDTMYSCLVRRDGNRCMASGCTVTSGIWNGKPIRLQVDHIDGNAGNHSQNNLRLLCANCHSQTDTFSARNKGNGRKSRGLPRR